MEQWGATATASSAYGTGTASWAASQATGAPNVTGCTSSGQAWLASSSTAGQWLEVGYAAPAKAVGVRIHETGTAGTVTKVELVDEGGTAHEVWAGSDGTLCGQWLEVKLPETAYRVAKVKVTTKAQTQVDAVGLVTEPAAGPTATVGYEYDANGLRTRRSDAAGVTSYLLDGLSVVGTYDATGTRQAWYTQSPARIDEVLNVSNGQGKYWYQADALGSIYALTTASGAVQARGGYDVFGEPVAQGGTPVGQPFGFTGREHELDSGLVYARARYLSSGTGAWTQVDSFNLGAWMESGESRAPFSFGQRSGLNGRLGSSLLQTPSLLNYYSALAGNPVNQADPSGESGLSVGCLADGLVTAAILMQARRYDSVSASLLATIGRIARLATQAKVPELLALVATFVMLMEVADTTTTTVLIPGRPMPPPGQKFKPDCVTARKLLGDICRASPPGRSVGCPRWTGEIRGALKRSKQQTGETPRMVSSSRGSVEGVS